MFIELVVVLVLLIPILAIVLDSQVGRALASRLERKSVAEPEGLAAERLAFLESEVERLTKEVGRLDEESQFLQKLLTERSSAREDTAPPAGGVST